MYFLLWSIIVFSISQLSAQINNSDLFDHEFYQIDFYKVKPVDGKAVKAVKVWRRFKDQKEVMLGKHYRFNSDGTIKSLHVDDFWDQYEFYFSYTNDKRFYRVKFFEDHDSTLYRFAYKARQDIVERQYGSNLRKTFYYKDGKGRLIEKKQFFRDTRTAIPFRVGSRSVFNYNAKDSLFGEMFYNYNTGGGPEREKTIHTYDLKTGKRTSTKYFGPDGELNHIENYTYDDEGRLSRIERESGIMENYVIWKKEYRYKNGELSSFTFSSFNYGNPKDILLKEYYVYKNGRLIYSRYTSKGELLFENNFQYIAE